jgi:hypothetical protein
VDFRLLRFKSHAVVNAVMCAKNVLMANVFPLSAANAKFATKGNAVPATVHKVSNAAMVSVNQSLNNVSWDFLPALNPVGTLAITQQLHIVAVSSGYVH